jgi:hypothetical protein|tara:strand:- start:217 stop:423 length:207 start_codon:yes stop_codon:yes gene_type:complete
MVCFSYKLFENIYYVFNVPIFMAIVKSVVKACGFCSLPVCLWNFQTVVLESKNSVFSADLLDLLAGAR